MHVRVVGALGLIAMVALCSACGTNPSASSSGLSGTITVFAASSLNAAVVPCGHYASQALQKAGVSVQPASQEADVKAVLTKVALGEADAGIVYVTDVKAAVGAVEGVAIPPAVNVVAEYPIVILKDSHNRALSTALRSYVLTDGRPILVRDGFTNP